MLAGHGIVPVAVGLAPQDDLGIRGATDLARMVVITDYAGDKPDVQTRGGKAAILEVKSISCIGCQGASQSVAHLHAELLLNLGAPGESGD